MTDDSVSNDRSRAALISAGRSAQQFVVLVGWSVVYFTVVMVAMTGAIRLATGWDTVVVTSGSMSPTLRPGDVLFIDEHPDELVGQQTIITFESSEGELITHRIFATDEASNSYVTKGDANPTLDSELVSADDVVGVSWLVVPYLGLPLIWFTQGSLLPLFALLVVTLIAVVNAALGFSRGGRRKQELEERLSGSAQRGILRVRFVVGMVIVMLLAVGGRDLAFNGNSGLGTPTLLAALAALVAVSVAAIFRSRRTTGSSTRRLAVLELAADTVIVVVFVAASGSSSIGWVLMALPIVEAAISFRLTGAFVHWIIMSALSITALFWSNQLSNTPRSIALTNLEQLVDRLGVLLLVVIPASYLAEQLLGDVATQRRATDTAHDRSAIIERVTDAGLDVARLGVDVFPTLTSAAADLGFDCADCWAGDGSGEWRLLATTNTSTTPLPPPADEASAMRTSDLTEPEVYLTHDDPDEDAAAALDAAGFGVMIRLTLTHRESMYIVLRVAAAQLGDDPISQVKALRLLGAQAGIAMQNERLVSELKSTHAEIAHQARYDALTRLANRSHFSSQLSHELSSDRESSAMLSVLFLDLNGFKAVNDRLGHHIGDDLLIEVARRLSDTVGDAGVVGRLGGDEFTVMLLHDNAEAPEDLAARLHQRIDEPFLLAGELVSVSTSIGIAKSDNHIGMSEMMRRADVAMYAAKAAGGVRRTRRYASALDELERRTARLAESLRHALANDELHMVYQPIVVGGSGEIVGVESLIRWVHPELGPIPTDELLAIAESGEQIGAFNRWVIEHSILEVSALDWANTSSGDRPFLAVNVSPTELELDDLADHIQHALAAAGMAPSRLVIELSERMIAESPESIANIARLKELGVRLALDDFGEGHTSLTHLRRLPIDFLKLDRVFVRHAHESADDQAVLRSIVGLSHDLGFSVIAEGVESIEHLSIVSKAGAELVQGYGLYRPMPITDLAGVVTASIPAFESLSLADFGSMALTQTTVSDAGTFAMTAAGPSDIGALPPPAPGTEAVR